MKLFVLVIGVCIAICIARYVYGIARYVYGVARYENDIQCKVLEIYNIIVKHSISNSVLCIPWHISNNFLFLHPYIIPYIVQFVVFFKNPCNNIFRMDKTISIYDVRHSKDISAFLDQRKQLYDPDSCIIEITMNKTKGHYTPFMVQLPHLNPLIVPSSGSKNQDASYNLRKSRLDWELCAANQGFIL